MNVFFSGIGGVGIGPLAEIALDAGYSIQGSDLQASPLTHMLEKKGVSLSFNQDGSFLEACHSATPIDWFVHTSALPSDHPELLKARALGIKTAKRDELLAHIIEEKNLKLIAIAGTHGKTTTTGIMVWAMQQLGIPVSYSVGATLSFGPSGKYQPESEYFVYECDEFDKNFLHFRPYLTLITSLDYDHPDTYPTETDYLRAFAQFARQSEQVIMWQADDKNISEAASNSWVLRSNEVQLFSLPGEHNRRNATLVSKGLEYLGISGGDVHKIINQFPGTGRRFERLAQNLYSDYGHHPKEIAATLQLARELSDHIVLVYQPHQNVRQHEIKNAYTDCFKLAEEIYWLPTYLSREDPNLPILTPQQLSQNITNKASLHFAGLNDTLWDAIETARQNDKLVLIMGAGSIDTWVRNQLSV
ncbi:MAG TPA: Mur ligase domain-containing protein [Candidatus Saccharimonadales bacterium]|nr:Mur ligase domain-containing protein [Candidatus Saccharimonadales bacterium]